MLGKFNINAMDTAIDDVKSAIDVAKNDATKLCEIEHKTFMNFVRPLSDIENKLNEILTPIYLLSAVNNSPQSEQVMEKILPIISIYESDKSHHKPTYEGFLYVQKNDWDNMTDVQKLIVSDTIKGFEIGGINLDKTQQARLKEIATSAALLSNEFSNNIIAANKLNKIKIVDEKLLGDMPQNDKDIVKVDGGWEFSLSAPDVSKFMKYVIDPDLRLQMHKNYLNRAPQNGKIISNIMKLRIENAEILGYKNFADLALEFRDAKSANQITGYLENLALKLKPMEISAYNKLCDYAGVKIGASDLSFYNNKFEDEKLSISDAIIKPYFELNKTVENTLKIISEMFDIKFEKKSKNTWHRDVLYYEVSEKNSVIGGLYLDLTARPSKEDGGWMGSLKTRHRDANNNLHIPECYIVMNCAKQTADTPSLMSLGQVSTLFHELGHALHYLLSRTDELGAVDVDWDVVEFPSTFLEIFAEDKNILKKLGVHYISGEQIPIDLLNKIQALDNYGKSWGSSFMYEFFDMELHSKNISSEIDIKNLAQSAIKRFGLFRDITYNNFQNTFGHIFDGGYAAGYYSYVWSRKFAYDAAIEYKKSNNKSEFLSRYKSTILALGGSKPMNEIYMDFLGKEPDINNYFEYYNLK